MILTMTTPGTTSSGKPRASGDDPILRPLVIHGRIVNPARAGMILVSGDDLRYTRGKPRASGDDPPVFRFARIARP